MFPWRQKKTKFRTDTVRAIGINSEIRTPIYETTKFDRFEKKFDSMCRKMIHEGAVDEYSKHYMEREINARVEEEKKNLEKQMVEHVRYMIEQNIWVEADDREYESSIEERREAIQKLDEEIAYYESLYQDQIHT